jgi:hypothetical protein
MSLREKAKQLADGEEPTGDQPPIPPASPAAPEPLPEPDIPAPGEDGPENVPVVVAWSRVMETVRVAAKSQFNQDGGKYWYRGVDQALNLFGPACRLHGVLVIPIDVETSYRDTKTSRGNSSRECTVLVKYRIYGPGGDWIEGQAAGEALDWSDKGTAKAQAVALRTFLFHAGLVPTQDPDPDSQTIDRGEMPRASAADYRDEALNPNTSVQRLRTMYRELGQQRMAGQSVVNENGDDEPIGELVKRIGSERSGGGA